MKFNVFRSMLVKKLKKENLLVHCRLSGAYTPVTRHQQLIISVKKDNRFNEFP